MNKDPEMKYHQWKELGNNNFHCHFVRGNHTYRRKPPFLRFQDEYRELEERLTNQFTEAWNVHTEIPWGFERLMDRFRPELYDAYKLMRVYAESDSGILR